MKTGDLVKLKYIMFWHLKNNPYLDYTEEPFLVLSRDNITQIRLLDPRSNRRFNALVESFEVVGEGG
tara:strand:- start:288 stop:488 length:201 start_codon:yes stop_codon:yes gene_type:complete